MAGIPKQMFIRVDLPAPFSPTRATTSPAPTEKPTSESTRDSPKDLLTPSHLNNVDSSMIFYAPSFREGLINGLFARRRRCSRFLMLEI